MVGGPIDFKWMEHNLNSVDIREGHKFNYLRHRLWMRKKRDLKKS